MDLQNTGVGSKELQELLDEEDIAAGVTYDGSSVFVYDKMVEIRTKISGRGGDLGTNILNMVELAEALGRPAFYTAVYIGYEVGTSCWIDEKTQVFKIFEVHSAEKLAQVIEKFMKKYVGCYECGSPETEVVIVSKSRSVNLKCGACGFNSQVDMVDKLARRIIWDHFPEMRGFMVAKPQRQDFKFI